VAFVCLIIGTLYLSNKIDTNVQDDHNIYVH
jgi:hypothetical protein